jgi:hypothetical protein
LRQRTLARYPPQRTLQLSLDRLLAWLHLPSAEPGAIVGNRQLPRLQTGYALSGFCQLISTPAIKFLVQTNDLTGYPSATGPRITTASEIYSGFRLLSPFGNIQDGISLNASRWELPGTKGARRA